jgi:hypothetical protein
MSQLYSFIFHYLEENKLKIFRWKLLQYIVPTKKLLMKWRFVINSQCNFCGQDEDYLYYFVSCPYYVSEQKTKQVNIYSLFVREYITRISQAQKLQNCKLLAKIRENIEM